MPTLIEPLSVEIGGLRFPSLILNASGAFNPELFGRLFPLKETLGGIVTKTVTARPQAGNPQPRTKELPGIGMLNSIGIQNPGLAYFLDHEAASLKQHGLPLVLSISAHSVGEFVQMAEAVLGHADGAQIDALELNLSCPNVEKGGIEFGCVPDLVTETLGAVTAVYKKPVFAKLTPNAGDMVPIAESAIAGGAAALTAINTVLGAAINLKTRKPYLKRVSAGYSGPGIKPIALHHVYRLRKYFPEIPIIGVGGISNTDDVLEFLMAGANLVQVGTICFREPMIFQQVSQDLSAFCRAEGLANLQEIVGCAQDYG